MDKKKEDKSKGKNIDLKEKEIMRTDLLADIFYTRYITTVLKDIS